MSGKLVVGNWKMNLLRSEAEELSRAVAQSLGDGLRDCEVVLAPPFTSLDAVRSAVSGSAVELGAQNAYGRAAGAFTGEVSAAMLPDAGCRWVILGHSERRSVMGETDALIREKVVFSLECGLKVVLCVGETDAQRERAAGEKGPARKDLLFGPIRSQLEGALDGLDENSTPGLVVAYEPVWAIGTGKNAARSEIEEIHGYIGEFLAEIFPVSGNNIRILYGGSVSPGNVGEIMSVSRVDGVLVGGASLSAGSFLEIARSVGE